VQTYDWTSNTSTSHILQLFLFLYILGFSYVHVPPSRPPKLSVIIFPFLQITLFPIAFLFPCNYCACGVLFPGFLVSNPVNCFGIVSLTSHLYTTATVRRCKGKGEQILKVQETKINFLKVLTNQVY
jgi:hypothetical protein